MSCAGEARFLLLIDFAYRIAASVAKAATRKPNSGVPRKILKVQEKTGIHLMCFVEQKDVEGFIDSTGGKIFCSDCGMDFYEGHEFDGD